MPEKSAIFRRLTKIYDFRAIETKGFVAPNVAQNLSKILRIFGAQKPKLEKCFAFFYIKNRRFFKVFASYDFGTSKNGVFVCFAFEGSEIFDFERFFTPAKIP